jgi:hypothetical protein
VQLLIEEIVPRVWERDPAIMCEIIGADWPAIFPDALDHRIWLAGSVPDLTTVFDRVRLTIAPLRFGAGIKGKVLESFAAGVPCVMSPVAAEGLTLTADLERLIGKTSQQLADLICDLHAGAECNAVAGVAGTSMVADAFSFAQVVAGLRSAANRTTRLTNRPKKQTENHGVGGSMPPLSTTVKKQTNVRPSPRRARSHRHLACRD